MFPGQREIVAGETRKNGKDWPEMHENARKYASAVSRHREHVERSAGSSDSQRIRMHFRPVGAFAARCLLRIVLELA
jgi:hypothetical protein